jgi:hypothetical protein
MALHWNVTKCKNHKALTNEDEWPITNALIWGSMSTGIREITEENIPEIYARFRVWEGIVGAMLHGKDTETGEIVDRHIEVADLVKRIGLTTNASSMTRAEWRKGIANYLDREANEHKRDAERKTKEAA